MTESEALQVYGYVGLGELLDVSPFVSKLEAYLRLAGVPYAKHPGDPNKAPRGKLPYVRHAGRTLADSQRIIEYLAAQGIADLDAWLDAAQRAELFALRSMVENDLYFVILHYRWQTDAGWAQYQPAIAGFMREAGVPGLLLRPILRSVRKGAVAQCKAQGTGLRDEAEILAHARELFATLASFLARREGLFWFGDRPTSADAILHAFVGAAIVPRMQLPLEQLADPHPRLRAWFEHVDAQVRALAGRDR